MSNHVGKASKLSRKVEPAWLRLNGQIGKQVNTWAGRDDIIAYLGEDGGQGQAAAMFIFDLAECEINTKMAFGNANPKWIGDFTERDTQFEYLVASGAALHEAMHARHTTFDLGKVHDDLKNPRTYDALMLLEEGRIEAKGLLDFPRNRAFFRASALELALKDMESDEAKNMSDTRLAGMLAGLALARVDAGILSEDDVIAAKDVIDGLIPADVLENLRDVWIEFQEISYPEYDYEHMYTLARRWVDLLDEQAEKNGEPDQGGSGEGESKPQQGEGEPQEGSSSSAAGQAMREALREDADMSEIAARSDAERDQAKEDAEQRLAEAEAKADEKEANEKEAGKVFGKDVGHEDGARTNSRLIKEREPTDKERVAAVTIGKELDKARYVEREVVKARSTMPPGRLRGGAIVQRKALAAQHIRKETEPFIRKQRTRTDEPHLTVGIMVDISGSMSAAMEPMAVSSWVMAQAAQRVNAKVASVYYGYSAFPTLRPGQKMPKVQVWSAADGTEKFDSAFRALDGQMNMLNGKGARLIVIVSDGQYTHEEQANARKWLKRCEQAGVGVLWIGTDTSYNEYAIQACKTVSNAEFIMGSKDPTGDAMKIGQAAAKAITAAGKARG